MAFRAFRLRSNRFDGMITSAECWFAVILVHARGWSTCDGDTQTAIKWLAEANIVSPDDQHQGYPVFSMSATHRGLHPTLGEWARENGMDLEAEAAAGERTLRDVADGKQVVLLTPNK